ncbi:MAG: hypothetical protein EA403_06185 [Spirochaetaceae bacterium]|nr:MAG: hypothetical protein EA403_06185 [Spirochaetaceae bacterium]
MRRFLVILILLLIAAATGFYFGWIQFQIPADRVAVVFTKTGGWDSVAVRPGTFHWRWENLLPTNLTLHLFDVSPQQVTVRTEGTLPSGDLYRRYLEGDVDFSYVVELSFRFRINPDALPALVSAELLTPETLPSWYEEQAAVMTRRAVDVIDSIFRESGDDGRFSVSAFSDQLQQRLADDHPELEIVQITPVQVLLPDVDLYLIARQIYREVIAARAVATTGAAAVAAGDEVRLESKLATLARYGELLNQFPVLLEYFALTAERGIDPLDIQALRSLAPAP